jgi:hypothetical protein
MKERPIIFSSAMVRAILDGKKSQTRRVVDFHHPYMNHNSWKVVYPDGGGNWIAWDHDQEGLAEFTKRAYPNGEGFPCQYGQVGEKLYVRETHYRYGHWIKNGFTKTGKQKWTFKTFDRDIRYFDKPPNIVHGVSEKLALGWFKRPSIFMPRWASRILLEITEVRVQRVQEITEEDAVAEGIPPEKEPDDAPPAMRYATLWDAINAKNSWASNPWCWAISFKRVECTQSA